MALHYISFKGGPLDGETRTYLKPQPNMTEVAQPGSSTRFVYRLYMGPVGPMYVFEKPYRPATQECEGR
jgi:hypothetical protein